MLVRMESFRTNRAAGAAVSASAYVVALVVAILVVRATGLDGALAQTALGTLVATVVIFAASRVHDRGAANAANTTSVPGSQVPSTCIA